MNCNTKISLLNVRLDMLKLNTDREFLCDLETIDAPTDTISNPTKNPFCLKLLAVMDKINDFIQKLFQN